MKAIPKFRILILDADAVARRWLGRLIESEPGFKICAEAAGMGQALEEISSTQPDIAVVDVDVFNEAGAEAVKFLKQEHPLLPVVAVSMREKCVYGRRILRAGASAYVTKEQAASRIISSIRRTLQKDSSGKNRPLALRRFGGHSDARSRRERGAPRSHRPEMMC